jgi:hypothetical protein
MKSWRIRAATTGLLALIMVRHDACHSGSTRRHPVSERTSRDRAHRWAPPSVRRIGRSSPLGAVWLSEIQRVLVFFDGKIALQTAEGIVEWTADLPVGASTSRGGLIGDYRRGSLDEYPWRPLGAGRMVAAVDRRKEEIMFLTGSQCESDTLRPEQGRCPPFVANIVRIRDGLILRTVPILFPSIDADQLLSGSYVTPDATGVVAVEAVASGWKILGDHQSVAINIDGNAQYYADSRRVVLTSSGPRLSAHEAPIRAPRLRAREPVFAVDSCCNEVVSEPRCRHDVPVLLASYDGIGVWGSQVAGGRLDVWDVTVSEADSGQPRSCLRVSTPLWAVLLGPSSYMLGTEASTVHVSANSVIEEIAPRTWWQVERLQGTDRILAIGSGKFQIIVIDGNGSNRIVCEGPRPRTEALEILAGGFDGAEVVALADSESGANLIRIHPSDCSISPMLRLGFEGKVVASCWQTELRTFLTLLDDGRVIVIRIDGTVETVGRIEFSTRASWVSNPHPHPRLYPSPSGFRVLIAISGRSYFVDCSRGNCSISDWEPPPPIAASFARESVVGWRDDTAVLLQEVATGRLRSVAPYPRTTTAAIRFTEQAVGVLDGWVIGRDLTLYGPSATILRPLGACNVKPIPSSPGILAFQDETGGLAVVFEKASDQWHH